MFLLILETYPPPVSCRALAGDPVIPNLMPRPDIIREVVEDIVAPIGGHGKHGMPDFLWRGRNGDTQSSPRQARRRQQLTFGQCIVFAVAVTVCRYCPIF